MALIEVENLEKTYKNEDIETLALRGVSFKIEEGEFVAIMGPSGSGKSTLLHILGFLDRPTGGNYLFEGKTINDYSEDELARVRNSKMGFVFQAFNLLPRTSVLENIKMPLAYSSIDENKWDSMAKYALGLVDLTHRMSHDPNQLSGGEKQRVAIARALVLSPRVIFADEPTGNLDSKTGDLIMRSMKELNKKGHTILLITHESYTAAYANRMIRLKDGKIDV